MLLFCPHCGNILLIANQQDAKSAGHVFSCQTCPYIYPISGKYIARTEMRDKRKQIDDVLGGADAWTNVDRTDATCPKCENTRAYYMQIQIRSADEPSSIFYRCCNQQCNYQWREG